MVHPDPPAGYLSNADADALLEPVDGFALLERDAITHRFVYDLCEVPVGDLLVKVFNYGHSMGHGGGMLYGESDWSTCLVELPAANLPHFQIRRRTLVARLRLLFKPALAEHLGQAFNRRYVVTCGERSSELKTLLTRAAAEQLMSWSAPLSVEGDGDHILAMRKGALRPADLHPFAKEVGELIRSFCLPL